MPKKKLKVEQELEQIEVDLGEQNKREILNHIQELMDEPTFLLFATDLRGKVGISANNVDSHGLAASICVLIKELCSSDVINMLAVSDGIQLGIKEYAKGKLEGTVDF